jgi:hypothetical protein
MHAHIAWLSIDSCCLVVLSCPQSPLPPLFSSTRNQPLAFPLPSLDSPSHSHVMQAATYHNSGALSYYDSVPQSYGGPPSVQHPSIYHQSSPPHQQQHGHQPIMQGQRIQQQQPTSSIVGSNAHYSLVQHHQQQQQSHPGSAQPSPYRGVSNHQSPAMQMQQQRQQQQPGVPPHLLPPHARPGFARELFPHELPLSGGGLGGLKQESPPPEEYSIHEKNVRSITESPPPEQIASMLSQILSSDSSRDSAMRLPQQSQMRPLPVGLTPHQQQLYQHFNKMQAAQPHNGAPQSAPPQPQQFSQQPPPQQFSRPAGQLSYYDQMGAGGGGGGMYSSGYTNNSQTLHTPSLPSPYSSHVAPPSPSSIPGMSSIIDPGYYAEMKRQQQQQQQQQQMGMQGMRGGGSQQQQQQQLSYMSSQPLQSRSQSQPEYSPHAQMQQQGGGGAGERGFYGGGGDYQDHSHYLHPSPPSSIYPLQSSPQHTLPSPQGAMQAAQLQAFPHASPPPGLAAPPGFQKGQAPPPSSSDSYSRSSNPPYTQDQRGSISRGEPMGSPQSGPPGGQGGSKVPPPPFPRRTQSLGDTSNFSSPPSHEAVSVSLSRAGRADVSRFSAGPPNQESRGFVARCCTEARRGRGSASSVLSRGGGGRRGSKSDAFIPLSNPYGNLQSSPELPEPAWSKPSPVSTTTPFLSNSSTPLGSPIKQPRARMPTPLLPPK